MSKYLNLAFVSLLAMPALGQEMEIGREALSEEIAAWNVDVMPDGTGLPEGSGDVMTGETLFLEYCASCHGDFAEGLGNWPALAGGEGTLDRKDPVKTVGSYWPYLSTVWDYVHRSMPFGQAQILTADETYAITAYILYSNYLVEEDFVLSRETFSDVEMTNADGFIVDDRPETEYPVFSKEPCMENCKDNVEVTMRASNLDVTPGSSDEEEDAAESETAPSANVEAESEEPKAEDAQPEAEATNDAPAEGNTPDPELIAAGEKVFAKCKACHMVGEGAKNRAGPVLNGVVGREAGSYEGFKFSDALKDSGITWDEESLKAFLADPRGTIPKNKMGFPGLKSDEDIAALIAWLKTQE